MRDAYPRKTIYVAPNPTERMGDSAMIADRSRVNYLYVGRMTSRKRPDLLLSGRP